MSVSSTGARDRWFGATTTSATWPRASGVRRSALWPTQRRTSRAGGGRRLDRHASMAWFALVHAAGLVGPGSSELRRSARTTVSRAWRSPASVATGRDCRSAWKIRMPPRAARSPTISSGLNSLSGSGGRPTPSPGLVRSRGVTQADEKFACALEAVDAQGVMPTVMPTRLHADTRVCTLEEGI